jgi:hypothetical protein
MGDKPSVRGFAVAPHLSSWREAPPTYEPPGLGRLRKIALIGTANTYPWAPFHDPSWEIWAHNSAIPICPRVDRIFELHSKFVWSKKKHWHKDYQKFLRECPVPIYMQRHWPDIPQSIRYPRERVLSEFRRYFSSQAAWMIALALTEGVTHLGFYGIHYEHSSERDWQRQGCEYWMGMAEGRGVQLVIPEACPLLKQPKLLYGYESHDKAGKNIIAPRKTNDMKFSPAALTLIDMDKAEGRPPLAELPQGAEPNWEQTGHTHYC